jgi:hypothetical protein
MDDTDHALFPSFSAELVATALKDTPVVMVTGRASAARPPWSAIWSRAIANSSPWTTTRCWLRHAIQRGSCGLSSEVDLVIETEVAH